MMESGELFGADHAPMQRVTFSNPDIHYLTRRYEVEAKFIGRMLRIFGEAVVLESLRRFEKGWSEAVFVGIARNVEKAYAQEA
jgi:hypothetical protein